MCRKWINRSGAIGPESNLVAFAPGTQLAGMDGRGGAEGGMTCACGDGGDGSRGQRHGAVGVIVAVGLRIGGYYDRWGDIWRWNGPQGVILLWEVLKGKGW
jgi:hypothetical protein